MPTSYDIAIIGGGVIGLAIAHALTERRSGRRVAVVEAQTGSREASWAAAGMLAPYSEFNGDTPLFRLCRDSADMYPDFVRALREETGAPCTLVDTGCLLLQRDTGDAQEIDLKLRFMHSLGIDATLLEGPALRECEPNLGPDVRRAVLLPERSVNNRQLWDALAAACRTRGVDLQVGTPVHAVEREGERIRAVRTPAGDVHADIFILAAGAWSTALGDLFGVTLPVVPVKGQMLRYDVPDGSVRHTLHRGSTYVVPRPGYGVIVGTTVEDRGFDTSVDDAAIAGLVRGAAGLVPLLAECAPCETWAGLRPKAPDAAPILGPAPGCANLFLATGHFRNGILLTPITGTVLADLVDGTELRDLAPFSPARF